MRLRMLILLKNQTLDELDTVALEAHELGPSVSIIFLPFSQPMTPTSGRGSSNPTLDPLASVLAGWLLLNLCQSLGRLSNSLETPLISIETVRILEDAIKRVAAPLPLERIYARATAIITVHFPYSADYLAISLFNPSPLDDRKTEAPALYLATITGHQSSKNVARLRIVALRLPSS